jgi:hypothetical protein
MLRRRWPIIAFAAWSAYVWVTRIANAWTPGSEETTAAKVVSTVSAGVLLVGVLATAVILVRARARALAAAEVLALRVFVGLTVAVWAVRVPQILLDGEHNVGFKVVHTALAVLSVVLGALTWRRATTDPIEPVAGTARAAGAVSPLPSGRR